jgi:hypothetical protein
MHAAAEHQSPALTGIPQALPRLERMRITLHAIGIAALTLVGVHRH